MKLIAAFLLLTLSLSAQNLELTPNGFAPVEIPRPDKRFDQIQDQIKYWLGDYNRNNEYGYDVYDVTESSLKIDASKDNAFYYQNKGETFQHRIKYTLAVEIKDQVIVYKFSVKEIYAKKVLTNLTVAKFFTSEGKLKSDYLEVKPSLERTANDILNSFEVYMALLK
ncbi:hypothetical protein [Flavobacterium silvaticum]|uniref:DUF4468 domain-containing protein n=1 Tax=Flavobacterium silvaticum TaxID=1852020 RepID=A0A972FU92_9FLAO|nr:hypothetical protein [Flavobacterium silvaticum]NMH28132.1 hypothetical protein [Flavobacterium silvaticum]